MTSYVYQPSLDAEGHLISEPCLAGNLIHELERRGIAPDSKHSLPVGDLSLWIVGNMYAGLLVIDSWQLTSDVRYHNTTAPEIIAADILRRNGGHQAIGDLLGLPAVTR